MKNNFKDLKITTVLFLIVAFCLVSIGCSAVTTRNETKEPVKAVFQENIFKFEYPSNWTTAPSNLIDGFKEGFGGTAEDDASIAYINGIADSDGNDLEAAIIFTNMNQQEISSELTDEIFENFQQNSEQYFPGILSSPVERSTVSGLSAILGITEMPVEGITLKYKTYYIFSGKQGSMYYFSLLCDSTQFDRHESVFDDVIRTLEITN